MKLRLSRVLYGRLQQCAMDVGDTIGEYVDLCIKHVTRGSIQCVAFDMDVLLATREGSTCITIHDREESAADIRRAILSTVAYAESRRPPEFKTKYVEYTDYLIADEQGDDNA